MTHPLVRRLIPFLILPLLAASECSEAGVNSAINEAFGIDTDNPTQVVGAILLAQTLGSEEEQQAAAMGTTLKDFRRADHEQKGDRLYQQRDFDGAAKEYREALRWTGEGAQQDQKRMRLEHYLGGALYYKADAVRGSDAAAAAKAFREAADHYGRAAALSTTDADRDMYYESQAGSYYDAGDLGASCAAARRMKGNGIARENLLGQLKAKGLTCG